MFPSPRKPGRKRPVSLPAPAAFLRVLPSRPENRPACLRSPGTAPPGTGRFQVRNSEPDRSRRRRIHRPPPAVPGVCLKSSYAGSTAASARQGGRNPDGFQVRPARSRRKKTSGILPPLRPAPGKTKAAANRPARRTAAAGSAKGPFFFTNKHPVGRS